MKKYKVQLDYFKKSGKWYSEGSYYTEFSDLYEIFKEVRQKLKKGKRPGLVDAVNEFHVLITVPEHEFNIPQLILFETEATET